MSNPSSSKKIAIIVIVAIIVVFIWLLVSKAPSQNNIQNSQATASEEATSQTASVVNALPVDPAVSQLKNSGVSDQSLNQDSIAIDAQLNSFSSESKNASDSTK